MKINNFLYAGLLLGIFSFTISCVDDKYDLSDIDTETAIKLNDLTVPVKLSSITLDNVLDVDEEDSLIKVYEDKKGNEYYAIQQDGYFYADPVKIKELELRDYFTVPTFTVPTNTGKIENAFTNFSYLIKDVDEALVSLTYFGLNENKQMEINLSVAPSSATLENVKLQIPETYEATYGGEKYSGGEIPVTIVNGVMEYPVYVKTMAFNPAIAPDENHNLDITGIIGIKKADVASPEGDISLSFTMSPYSVNEISGSIDYLVSLPEIEPVELTGLPDFLTEGETTLILQNPQLYLNFSSLYGANYNTSLIIYPEGEGTEIISVEDLVFQESIVMAPDTENLGLEVSSGSTVLKNATQLMNILKGKGLPERLIVELDPENTRLDGEVLNLVLGTEDGIALSGSYKFFTPLAFAQGSQIIYQKKEEDFFGDDVEDVIVNHFRIQADAISELPTDVTLIIYPLDKEGNRIQGRNGSISASSTLAQGSSKLDLEISESFKNLDGLEYIVTANNMDGVSLSPSQTITLNNIKATLSGEYVTKL